MFITTLATFVGRTNNIRTKTVPTLAIDVTRDIDKRTATVLIFKPTLVTYVSRDIHIRAGTVLMF